MQDYLQQKLQDSIPTPLAAFPSLLNQARADLFEIAPPRAVKNYSHEMKSE